MIHDGGLTEGEARQKAAIHRESYTKRDGTTVTNYTMRAPRTAPPAPSPKQEEQLTWTFEEFQKQARQRGW